MHQKDQINDQRKNIHSVSFALVYKNQHSNILFLLTYKMLFTLEKKLTVWFLT